MDDQLPVAGHFNQLSAAEAERLAMLSEECAEVIHAISKILRHGYESVNPTLADTTNREDLERECGDILARMELLFTAYDIRIAIVKQYKIIKLKKRPTYFHHQPFEIKE